MSTAYRRRVAFSASASSSGVGTTVPKDSPWAAGRTLQWRTGASAVLARARNQASRPCVRAMPIARTASASRRHSRRSMPGSGG
ncbi:hypothetical protein ACFQ1I_02245 [Kitasatospora arboriphila]